MEIKGKEVRLEQGSHSVEIAAEYLNKHPDMAEAFFDEAKHDLTNGVAHFETPHDGEHPDVSHHFTLVHHGDGSYELRKRTGY